MTSAFGKSRTWRDVRLESALTKPIKDIGTPGPCSCVRKMSQNVRTGDSLPTARRWVLALPGTWGSSCYPLSSLISGAGAVLPSQASADGTPGLPYGRPCDTYAVDSGPAQATSDSHLCDHLVWRSKRRGRHALCRGCDC